MKAFIVAQGTTGLEGLKAIERERPSPGAGEVLVRMRAASMNFRDLAIVAGKYFRGPVERRSHIPQPLGKECARRLSEKVIQDTNKDNQVDELRDPKGVETLTREQAED